MNKKTALLLLCLCGWTSAGAQTGKKGKASTPSRTVEECLNLYAYDEAEAQLKRTLETQKRKRQSTEQTEALLEQVERGQSMLQAVEKVTFIDSFVVDKKRFLQTLRISSESGTMDSYAHFFNRPDSMGCTVYRPELGNKIYYSEADRKGTLRLYSSDLIAGEWTAPTLLKGLDENDEAQNYPFMLSDGVTLYYAAKGEESLGGYDIFVSRYDTDTKQFLHPENIGMPFNSPANDYLFAWDEYYKLGWFASDRNQPEDKVCLYVFIPNETREVYPSDDTDSQQLSRLARIHSIADTWTDKKQVSEARQRLQTALTYTAEQKKTKDFDFVIDDKRPSTQASDFQSPAAKKMIAWWQESRADLYKSNKQLHQLRELYSHADATRRKQLESEIMTLEQGCEKLQTEIRTQEKKIRNTEIKFLRK